MRKLDNHLIELHRRAEDLVDDLPEEVSSEEQIGHSVDGLFHHMISAEANWMSCIDGSGDPPDIASIEELERFSFKCLREMTLEAQFLGPRFDNVGQAIRHLQWHWAYHSAQVGLLRRELGFRYRWN